MTGLWLFHPESPGMKVFVVRGVWGRLLKPQHFATQREVEVYRQFMRRMSYDYTI